MAAAHERFQRGLLFRHARYVQATPVGWREGVVVLLRPAGPDAPERVWILVPGAQAGLPQLNPQAPVEERKRTVVALAGDRIPTQREVAQLEATLGLPLVIYSLEGAAGGPMAEGMGAVRELAGTLGYPDAQLARVNVEAAFREMGEAQDLYAFMERLKRLTPRVWVTPAIVGLCVLIWLIQVVGFGFSWLEPDATRLIPWGACVAGLVASQPWRLLTAGFLHFGIVHLGIDMYVLWDLGYVTERLFGWWAFLVVYLTSIVGGFLASTWWHWGAHPMVVAGGASGGIFGLGGAAIGFMLVRRHAVPHAAFFRLMRAFLLFVGLNLLFTLGLSGVGLPIDNAGHLGGLLTGLVAGALLSRDLPPLEPAPTQPA